jgi:hypothetical protein
MDNANLVDHPNDTSEVVTDDDYEDNDRIRARVLYSLVRTLTCCVVKVDLEGSAVIVYDGNEVVYIIPHIAYGYSLT